MTGFVVALAIAITLINGVLGMLYVFKRVWLDT